MRLRLQDFMSRDVLTIPPDAPADQAWETMKRASVRHLVVTRDHQVEGVISERDLGGRSGASLRKGRSVAELMVRHAVTARPEFTLRQAANILRGRGIGCLPVMAEDGRLEGIVTISDVLEIVGRGSAKAEPGDARRRGRQGPPRTGRAARRK